MEDRKTRTTVVAVGTSMLIALTAKSGQPGPDDTVYPVFINSGVETPRVIAEIGKRHECRQFVPTFNPPDTPAHITYVPPNVPPPASLFAPADRALGHNLGRALSARHTAYVVDASTGRAMYSTETRRFGNAVKDVCLYLRAVLGLDPM